MNSNLVLFIAFLWLFIINFLFPIEISGDYFLSSLLNNNIRRAIILGVVLFIFGKKYVESLEEVK